MREIRRNILQDHEKMQLLYHSYKLWQKCSIFLTPENYKLLKI